MSQEILALRLFRKRGISPNIIRRPLMRQPTELPGQKYSPTAEHLCRAGSFAVDTQNLSYYHSQQSIPISVLKPFGYTPGGTLNGQTLPKTGSIPNMVQRDTHSIFANVEFAY
jgi:hypothetical protein